MTAPAPSPQLPKEQEGQAVKKRRGMVGFYIATGVVVALFVGGWFAWTPLRIWYWERQAQVKGPGHAATEPVRASKSWTKLIYC